MKENMNAIIGVTVNVISAYVANNHVQAADLPALIAATHAALTGLGHGGTQTASQIEQLTPARIRKSITHDALISFEDDRPYKTLRRHLTLRGLSPEAYRAKWGLPKDYPMTAVGYSEARSKIAIDRGLGRKRVLADENVTVPAPEAAAGAAEPKKRSRKGATEGETSA